MKKSLNIEDTIISLRGFSEMFILISASKHITPNEQNMFALWSYEIDCICKRLEEEIE